VSGVAEDVRGLGVAEPPIEIVYFPIRAIPGAPLWESPTYMHLALRMATSTGTTDLTNAIARAVVQLEPEAAIANVQTMEAVLARSMAKQSFTMFLLIITAGMALLLSAAGLYGLISYVVLQRRKEIGVRLALGAQLSEIVSLILRQSLALALLGIAVGLFGALSLTRFLGALLFGVQPADPVTLVGVSLVLLSTATAAAFVPTYRAARVDPLRVLRVE
jgi:ABC-type antimicrobial peptide transport system permease subunit